MFRSAAAVLALAILPGLGLGQEPRTHTVVPGNTLWGIAEQHYGDPFAWPRIFEANRDRIENPHRIAPGLVVRIPDLEAPVTAVVVEPGPPAPMPPEPARVADVPFEPPPRTVFYRETDLSVVGVSAERALWDVPPHQFYSAPWLIPPGTTPERSGAIVGFAGGEEEVRMPRTSALPFDRLNVRVEGPPPPVGSRLQAFRVARDIPDVGHVVVPSGILVVEAVAPGGVVAVVETQFERVLVGDLVRLLPSYTPLPLDAVVPVVDGPEARVLAYASDREIQMIGSHAFLDAGANEGVSIGDEYVVVVGESPEWGGRAEGRAKVVAVLQFVSTARIVHLENPVFVPGVRLRPDRRVLR